MRLTSHHMIDGRGTVAEVGADLSFGAAAMLPGRDRAEKAGGRSNHLLPAGEAAQVLIYSSGRAVR